MSRLSSIINVPRSIFNRGVQSSAGSFAGSKLRKIVFNVSGFNQYGLYSHDMLDDEHALVKEVLRRLPQDVLDARSFRYIRAMQLDYLKVRLPKTEWITYEQDLQYRYMDPYLKEIAAERQEIYEFGCVNYTERDDADE